MDDRSQQQEQEAAEPVKTRWSPKPEQIMILESIFNNGFVNPPRDETVRIRKLLQRYGPVADANVFYWFQNRRSRSRRKQRQVPAVDGGAAGAGIPYENYAFLPNNNSMSFYPTASGSSSGSGSGSSSSFGPDGNSLSFPGLLQEYEQNPIFCSPPTNVPYQSAGGGMTVFINGVATEVGGVDIKGMFGGDFVLLHSSGIPVQDLQHGESYFLVPRQS